ncbi:MAG: hypothetical protein JXR78_19165 [Victivallales bacterium]|nr:hypothetical protein [Victivallales bacterium]
MKEVPGFKGHGVSIEDGGGLSFHIDKVLDNKRGAISLWICTEKDPVPVFAPCDMIGFSITGKNELDRNGGILKGRINGPGILFSFSSAYGIESPQGCRASKFYFGNEWRHYIYSWEQESGLRIYIDGRLFLASSSDQILKNLSRVKLNTLNLYTGNGSNPDDSACFDELRLFNRELSEDEALALYEQYVPAYPVLLDYATIAGSKKPFRVKMLLKANSNPVDMTILAENTEGKKLFEKTLRVPENGNYEIPFYPADPGVYRLVFLSGEKRIRTFEVCAVPAESITEKMPVSVSGNPRLLLVDEVDCSKDYPASRYLDDGEVAVVDSAIGRYRESTRDTFEEARHYGFVYNFTIRNPGKPHWLEIEYPDDKPRVFYVVVDQRLDNMGWGTNKFSHSYSLDTIGVANGINNPVTGRMSRKKLLFWPDSKDILVGCFGYNTFKGCAGPAMKNIRIYENAEPLSKLAVNQPAGMPQRLVGNWNEDPYMPLGCWFNTYMNNQGPSFEFIEEKMRRRIKYIRFMGQSHTVFQLFDYNGDNNGAYGMLPKPAPLAYMPGWACLAATMFERENIPFYIQFNDRVGLHQLIGLDKLSVDEFEASAKGMESLEFMSADGTLDKNPGKRSKDATLNFLHPQVREAHLRRIRFYREQFDIYNSFKGIMYYYSHILTFKTEKLGYGDYTISLFEKESGIKIPVDDKGMGRFNKRYNWLKNSNVWEKWINWRCEKVKDFLLTLAKELNGGSHKNLTLNIPVHTDFLISTSFKDKLDDYSVEINIQECLKLTGIDLVSLRNEPSLRLEIVDRPNYGLTHMNNISRNYDSFQYSVSFAELFENNRHPGMLLSRHANMEIYRTSPVIKNYWWPRGYWGRNGGFHCFSSVMPDNKYLPQTLAWGLAMGDVQHVDHGWWGNPENGAHSEFQKFYQAYRSIPALRFEKAPSVNDPVMVRQYNSPANSSGWFYLVNMQYYKTKVKMTLDSECKLTDTVFNRPWKLDGKILELELDPYQVMSFRSDRPVKIISTEQIVPENIVMGMTNLVKTLKTGAEMTPSPQNKNLARTAEDMLKKKSYSALYYLSRSYSAMRLLLDAKNPLRFTATLDPDRGTLDIQVENKTSMNIHAEVSLKSLPSGINCPDKSLTSDLKAKENICLNFPLSNFDWNNDDCRKELNFIIEYKVNDGNAKVLEYTFRPLVSRVVDTLNVDGDVSDWEGSVWYKLHKSDFHMKFKGDLALGLPPFDASFASRWSKKGLYLALRVNEKDLIPAPEKKTAWQYDFIELMFNQDINAENNKDVCTFFIANHAGGASPVITLAPAKNQTPAMASECLIARQRKDNTTTYELFIPAKVLNKVKFEKAANFGMAVKLHNREHKTSNLDLWDIAISTYEYPCGHQERWNTVLLSGSNINKLNSWRMLYDLPMDNPARFALNEIASRASWRALNITRGNWIGTDKDRDEAAKTLNQLKKRIESGMEWPHKTPPSYCIPYTSVSPVIDGNITDACWDKALTFKGSYSLNSTVRNDDGSVWKIMWDQKFIYVGTSFPDKDIIASEKPGYPYLGDSLEIFLMPSKRMKKYWEIIVGCDESIFEGFHCNNKYGGFVSDSNASVNGLQFKSLRKKDEYVTEVAIPFSELPNYMLGNAPKSGESIYFALVRTDKKKGENVKFYSSFPLLYGGHNVYGHAKAILYF